MEEVKKKPYLVRSLRKPRTNSQFKRVMKGSPSRVPSDLSETARSKGSKMMMEIGLTPYESLHSFSDSDSSSTCNCFVSSILPAMSGQQWEDKEVELVAWRGDQMIGICGENSAAVSNSRLMISNTALPQHKKGHEKLQTPQTSKLAPPVEVVEIRTELRGPQVDVRGRNLGSRKLKTTPVVRVYKAMKKIILPVDKSNRSLNGSYDDNISDLSSLSSADGLTTILARQTFADESTCIEERLSI